MSSNNIPINFRTKFNKELFALKQASKPLKETVDMIQEGYSEDIDYGSRVLTSLTRNDGSAIEGRVLGFNSKGLVAVNRDGYKSWMNFERKDLKNLSMGSYGKMEQSLWLMNAKIGELERLLMKSDMPECFLITEICIIKVVEVVEVIESSELEMVSFINAGDLKSYHFTLPSQSVKENGYYQVIIKENEIESVIKSDLIVFDAYKKK